MSPPKPPPVVNKTDTVHHVLSISPDSSATILIHSSTLFKLSAIPAFPNPYTIAWTIDTQIISRTSIDTITVKFDRGLTHSVKVVYIDSTGSRRDSIVSIVKIKDTTVFPGDTSSHDFAWTEFTNIEGQNNLTGVWVFDANNILAVNDGLYKYNGSTWNKVSWPGLPSSGLSGFRIFAFNPNDVWLTHNSLLFHWNGSVATSYRLENTGVWHYPEDGILHGTWGTSSHDMYFVGDSGTILHFDGSKWTKMTTPTKKTLASISGTSNNNVWACGYDPLSSETILLHYDGATWTEDQLSLQGLNAIGGFCGVWACDSASSPFVTASGSLLARKTGSSSWRIDTLDNKAGSQYLGMFFASGNTTNDFMTVADGGFITHWNGRSWHRYDSYFAPGNFSYVTNGFAMRGNTACVVGIKNGTSWVLIGQRK